MTEPVLVDEWRASFFITDKDLVIEYGEEEDPRNMSLEFMNVDERNVVEQVLKDPNFWVQIIKALSAALKEKM